jgi:hypothetical protein
MLQRIVKCWAVNVNSISRHRPLIKALDCMNGHTLTHTHTHSCTHGSYCCGTCSCHSVCSTTKHQYHIFPPTQLFTQTPKNNVITVKTFFCLTFHPSSGFLLTLVRTTTFHIHFTIIAGPMSYWFQNIRKKNPFRRPS